MHDDHNHQNRGHAQAHPSNAAQGFDLPAIQLWIVEKMLQPFVEHQQRDQNEDDDQGIEQQPVGKYLRTLRNQGRPSAIDA